MKAMEREKEELENEKNDLENQFEALKLMVEPYRCSQWSVLFFVWRQSSKLRYCTCICVCTILISLIRDQLESFEMERRALLAQNEVVEGLLCATPKYTISSRWQKGRLRSLPCRMVAYWAIRCSF